MEIEWETVLTYCIIASGILGLVLLISMLFLSVTEKYEYWTIANGALITALLFDRTRENYLNKKRKKE